MLRNEGKPVERPYFVEANEMDERLMEQNAGKVVCADGYNVHAVIHYSKQQKWLENKKRDPKTQNNFGEKNKVNEKEKQREQIQIGKDLFMVWDQDGGGSLSQNELVKSFVNLGLSQDYNFAMKIVNSIRPSDDGKEIEIRQKDFVTIFKKDEMCDKVIRMINEEIIFNEKLTLEKKS